MNEKRTTIVWRLTVIIIVIWMVRIEYFRYKDSIKADKIAEEKNKIAEEKDKIAERALLDRRIKDYMDCKGPACDNLYPDAAIVVKRAEAEAKKSN